MREKIITRNFPLTFTDLRLYVFSVIFITASVAFPYLAHLIHPLAGKMFLPMHFFVLLAGLIFGWRVGLLVGALSPLVSYTLSGMPILTILPMITFEIATYGFMVGLIQEKTKNIWLSLILALIIGRLTLLLTASFFLETSPTLYLVNALKLGWPGILIQILFVPLLSKKIITYLE